MYVGAALRFAQLEDNAILAFCHSDLILRQMYLDPSILCYIILSTFYEPEGQECGGIIMEVLRLPL